MIQNEDEKKPARKLSMYRLGLGILIIVLAIIYACAVITGHVPESRRIDSLTFAIIIFAVICTVLLLNPGAFDRLKNFEVRGFKFEMLEKVKERQAEQESKLEDISLIIPLVLSKAERMHIVNIADGKTTEYKGSHSVRSELRRLRTVGLIKSRPDMFIAKITDGSKVDLAKFVELTALGKRWVRRIREIEQAEMTDET